MYGVPQTRRGKDGNNYISGGNMDEADTGGDDEADKDGQAQGLPS